MLTKETHFRCKDTHRLKVKVWEKLVPENGSQKKTREGTFIPVKIDLKQRL